QSWNQADRLLSQIRRQYLESVGFPNEIELAWPVPWKLKQISNNVFDPGSWETRACQPDGCRGNVKSHDFETQGIEIFRIIPQSGTNLQSKPPGAFDSSLIK